MLRHNNSMEAKYFTLIFKYDFLLVNYNIIN